MVTVYTIIVITSIIIGGYIGITRFHNKPLRIQVSFS